jgi:hypothetical protein
MSELINQNDNRGSLRWQLLMGASAIVLTAAVAGTTAKAADDSDRPTAWIEIGGELQRMQGLSSPFVAPFMTITPTPAPYAGDPLIGAQHAPRLGMELDGKLSFQPENSHWIFSAGVQYGRSQSKKHIHHQTANKTAYFTFYFAYYHANQQLTAVLPSQPHVDSRTLFRESHTVLDFQAGRDVGLGLFGRNGSSTISGGVRFAQFNNRSSVNIQARPTVVAEAVYTTLFSGYISFPLLVPNFHQYALQGNATRSFRGVGPSLSWNASAALIGNSHDGELTMDWGVNAALLFGRQKANVSHATKTQHHYYTAAGGGGINAFHSHYELVGSNSNTVSRSRSVTVPNLAAFAGFSVKYPNAQFSFGYRTDFFFGAMDTGIDARQTKDVGFHGPFATISIGLGG